MIQAVEGKGLRVSLAEYRPVAAYQGGSDFWKPEFQTLIREWTPDPSVLLGNASLGRFLPRVQSEPGNFNSVIFTLYNEQGVEVASKSRPAGRFSVPESEKNELLRRFQLLRDRASASDVDADKRKAIEAFQLPNPGQEPDFYRVYGPPWRRRLLVLWGCERIHKIGVMPTLLPPATALEVLRAKVMPTWTSWGLKGGLALLSVIAALFLMCRVFQLPICQKETNVLVAGRPDSVVPNTPPISATPPASGPSSPPPSSGQGAPTASGPGAPSGPGTSPSSVGPATAPPSSGPGTPPRVVGSGSPPPSSGRGTPPASGSGAPPFSGPGTPLSSDGPEAPPPLSSGPGTPSRVAAPGSPPPSSGAGPASEPGAPPSSGSGTQPSSPGLAAPPAPSGPRTPPRVAGPGSPPPSSGPGAPPASEPGASPSSGPGTQPPSVGPGAPLPASAAGTPQRPPAPPGSTPPSSGLGSPAVSGPDTSPSSGPGGGPPPAGLRTAPSSSGRGTGPLGPPAAPPNPQTDPTSLPSAVRGDSSATAPAIFYPELVSQDHVNAGLVRVRLRAVGSPQPTASSPTFTWEIDGHGRKTGTEVSFNLPARPQPYALTLTIGRGAAENYELAVGVQPNVSLRPNKK